MPLRRSFVIFLLITAAVCLPRSAAQKASPARSASAAQTLLLPRRIVSGEHATLAVLDANGRLAPGVIVNFSNGDQVKTDETGRALFVAPLNPGVIFGSLLGNPGRIPIVILTAAEAVTSLVEVSSAPREVSLTDRFELLGKGFCGDADANRVEISGRPAIVLASSPASLTILPPSDLEPGEATAQLACADRTSQPFSISLVSLELEADPSPLKPGEHRTLTVRARGTTAKVTLEARNLSLGIAALAKGNPATATSSGGKENLARFELIGRKNGSFAIAIHLVPQEGK